MLVGEPLVVACQFFVMLGHSPEIGLSRRGRTGAAARGRFRALGAAAQGRFRRTVRGRNTRSKYAIHRVKGFRVGNVVEMNAKLEK